MQECINKIKGFNAQDNDGKIASMILETCTARPYWRPSLLLGWRPFLAIYIDFKISLMSSVHRFLRSAPYLHGSLGLVDLLLGVRGAWSTAVISNPRTAHCGSGATGVGLVEVCVRSMCSPWIP